MGKTISVSEYVYDQIDQIKRERDHQTIDSALRDLLPEER